MGHADSPQSLEGKKVDKGRHQDPAGTRIYVPDLSLEAIKVKAREFQ